MLRRLLAPAVLSAALATGLTACGDDAEPTASTPAATSASAAAAEPVYGPLAAKAVAAVPAEAQLLDVRERSEWDEGHAEDAILFPLARIEAGELPKLDKGAPIFVYCRTGRRAAIAVDIMRAAGFTDVTNIGGLDDWKAAGGAVVT